MQNPLEQAIRSGVRANDTVGGLFAKIGTAEHPRGFVVSAFRHARRAMKSAILEPYPVLAAAEVMAELRRTVRSDAVSLFIDAQAEGMDEAARQMRFYGVQTNPTPGVSQQALAAADALAAKVDAQAAAIAALLLTGSEDQVIGDEDRAGTLRPGEVAGLAAMFVASLMWSSFGSWSTGPQAGPLVFKKQAIAALDNRTTDCCLRVHGQIKKMDQPFHLTGTPRFADNMDWPGFHWFCRTAGVLYLDEFDLDLTSRMQAAASMVLSERAAGRWVDRNPANAF